MKKLLSILILLCLTLSGFSQGVQLVKIRQMPKPGPVLYNASTIRNITTYPLTTSGLNSFTVAASSGAFSLSVLCPCGETAIIPAGTKPPVTPPCATNCSTGPQWASSWYDYNGTLFSVRATGADQLLKFERADGQPLALKNPDNIDINNTTFYDHATLSGNIYQWQVNWPSAPSVKLTYKNKSTSATYTKTFTPAVGASNVNLFMATSTTVTQPPSQTVAGSFSFQAPTTESPWAYSSSTQIGFLNIPIGNVDFVENSQLRVEFRQGLGLIQVKDKTLVHPSTGVVGKWLINSPDLGRGHGPSSYTQQHWTDNVNVPGMGFTSNGPAPAPGPWFTGYNPLTNGDFAGNPSTVLFHGRITIDGQEYLYIRSQLNSWSHDNDRKVPMYLQQWVGLNGNKVIHHYRLTHNRTDDLTDYGPYLQEWCLMMINGNQTQAVYYNGDAPYTNGSVTYSRGFDDNGNVRNREFPISEPWIGVKLQDNSDKVIAQYSKDLYFPSYNHMDKQEGSDCDGCREGMYTSGHQLANLDAKGEWDFHITWIVGTVSEVRSFVYAQPHNTVPNYTFNATTQRNGWSGFNGVTDPQLPNAATNSGWATSWAGKADGGPANIDNSFLISPRTSFRAGDCPTLYVKGSMSNTSQTAWQIKYTYVGQERETIDGTFPSENAKMFPKGQRNSSQAVNFSMTPNGTQQTYTIPMNWSSNNQISSIEIWPVGSNLQTHPNLLVNYIGCTQP